MAHDHQLFVQTVARFTRTLVGPYELDDVLTDLVHRITAVLGLAGSGVVLGGEDGLQFVTAYSERIAVLERFQEATQTGACVDAFRTGELVVVPNLATEVRRWPGYSAVAIALGTSAVVGVPMRLHDRTFGALNLYGEGTRSWTEEDLAAAVVLTDMATGYLINASRHRQQDQLNEQLQQALDSRVVIEQAKGIVAQAEGVGVEQAFQRIRHYARSHGSPLREVAESIVRHGLRP